MTRKKKSRKPGVGSSGMRKTDTANNQVVVSDKKPKKKTGKAAGSRQLEGTKKKNTGAMGKPAKDPRVGSKKPIELGAVATAVTNTKPTKAKSSKPPIASVRVIDSAPSVAQQLAAIENDERLQLILAKQEQEAALSAEEVELYNELMDEYERLSGELEEQDEAGTNKGQAESLADDDLWDKLDTSDFSDYSDKD
ncbi:GTPase-activating protein [Thalassotalea euphylliae]|uniref:GTPase-activating protein n=1 Tax=Thalassotalea euphylliae TaxID=1655234 RepID=A0A3E0TW64_9GAMM|nr:Der GTPase-activating protein YihI [Thalassotalea euphylliae]REL28593.1 GTPase-activating protein [Thalassotalea euphylliae]